MNKNKMISLENPAGFSDPLHELIRNGARQLIQSAIESELQGLLERYQGVNTPSGQASAVRNGYLPERALQTGIGPVPVKIPKVR